MAYDEALADRVRRLLEDHADVTEKRMFGGLSFLLAGKMCCGIIKDDLMVRVGPDGHEEALEDPHARPMDFTGRPMRGFIYVGPDGLSTEEALARWVDRGVAYAESIRSE